MLKYRLQFFGSSVPFIVTKKKSNCYRAIHRDNVEMVAEMAGFIQVYYTEFLPDPISKKNMLVSVFLTRLNSLFYYGREYISQEDELWVFLGDGKYERTRPELKGVDGETGSISLQRRNVSPPIR